MYVLLEPGSFLLKEKRQSLHSTTALLSNIGNFVC